mmetsp:Transcript_27216/g.79956  ORF Transcript_27216/g.79956 Transcript_27216/m.79956 type:complete len:246 (-) Transcript_27216:12-749(-)
MTDPRQIDRVTWVTARAILVRCFPAVLNCFHRPLRPLRENLHRLRPLRENLVPPCDVLGVLLVDEFALQMRRHVVAEAVRGVRSVPGEVPVVDALSSVSGSDPLERPLTAAAQQLTHRARPKRGAAERLRRRESVVPAPRRQRCHSSHPRIVRTAGAAAIGAAIGAAVRPCTPLPEQPGRGKLERCRVQEHAVGAPVGAVRDVADDGVADVRHVQPQLVAPPRVRRQPQQRRFLPSVRRQHEPTV